MASVTLKKKGRQKQTEMVGGEEGMAIEESPVEQYPHRLGQRLKSQKCFVLSNYLLIFLL